MSEIHVEEASAPIKLPCPVPERYPTEPRELTEFRGDPGDDKAFLRLRKAFRDRQDWRALATLLGLHAAAIASDPVRGAKAIDLWVQSHELWLDRVKDRKHAAHALARAVIARPADAKNVDRLRKLYEEMGSYAELVTLLRWQLGTVGEDSVRAAALHLELAQLLEERSMAIGEAAIHYDRAVQLDPNRLEAAHRLIELYASAGAWSRASQWIEWTIGRLDPSRDRERVAALHRRQAFIRSEHFSDVAGAARSLQAALQAVPDDVEALRAFGLLYLASDRTSQDGITKASDIFYKAAELTRRRGDKEGALRLLRRSLHLAPHHSQASAALERTLIETEDWMSLDDLYREWSFHTSGADAVPLLLKRADLLDTRLHRREEARQLYEEASRFQQTDGEAWRKLERIYEGSGDYHALAALLDAEVERTPDTVSTETLLRAATVYREELGLEEKAAVYYYRVLEREPFNAQAFEGYKEHWRRKHNWAHLRDLILYQIDQATAHPPEQTPLGDPAFAEEFAELADICERRLGDIDGALDAWQRLRQAYPGDARPAKHIARIEKRARMWDNMVRVQETELGRTVDPAKRLDILKRLTQVYRDRQVNPTRAIELYNEILHLSPNDIQATRALTSLYDRAGDHASVVQMLQDQYERSRSNTEKISLLRRMSELWHHELDEPDRAVWACEQILEIASADKEALSRLQQLHEEQERWPELLDALQRELSTAHSVDAKTKILRRMARLAEGIGDDEAAEFLDRLYELKPDLEVADKLAAVYERSSRFADLASMLGKVAGATSTPELRQIDLSLRLGQLAETNLDDPELAKSSFERVLRLRPDHRGALEALVRLYRGEDDWAPLAAVLGKLQELAETDDDAFRLGWERSEIASEHLDDAEGAARILAELAQGPGEGRPEVATTLRELYERSGQYRLAVRQAESMLLAAEEPQERRALYETISRLWREQIDDPNAALDTYARLVAEFPEDLDARWTLAELREKTGDVEGALETLQQRLEMTSDLELQTQTLVHMAGLAETRLSSPTRAIEFLRRALAGDHFNEAVIREIDRIGREHETWDALLSVYEERFGYLQSTGRYAEQVDVCLEAANLAESRAEQPQRAFDWARRGYFVAIEHDLPAEEAHARLEALAETHDLWPAFLGVIEREVDLDDERSTPREGYDPIERLLAASQVAEDRLRDPDKAVALLQRAHRLRPDDEELAARLEGTAERYGRWQAVIELWGGRLKRATTDLARFDACAAIARVYEDELEDPEKAFEWLQKAWRDQRDADPALADDAFDRLVALAERRSLWPSLCGHHLTRADDAKARANTTEHLAALQDAARVFEERLEDPIAAVRVLVSGIPDDPSGDVLLPEIRRLADVIDASDGKPRGKPPIGALSLLRALQDTIARSETELEKVALLEERASIRRERLEDPKGAMAEWLRVLRLEPDHPQAPAELEALAQSNDDYSGVLLWSGWRLERETSDDAQAERYLELAAWYEDALGKSEYALRARLSAWRLDGRLPPYEGPMPEPHPALWRLAERTGAYRTPPVPKDPLLTPSLPRPEDVDLRRWERTGFDPTELFFRRPSPFTPRHDLATPSQVRTGETEPVSLDEPSPAPVVSGYTQPVDLDDVYDSDLGEDEDETLAGNDALARFPGRRGGRTGTEVVEEIEDLDEIEELDLEEIQEFDDEVENSDKEEHKEEDPTLAGGASRVPDASQDATRTLTKRGGPPLPPPPPRAPDAGLPAVPTLSRPVLPPRPKVANAWEEVALAYTQTPTVSKAEQAEVALVLARLWEEGANNLERAFAAHEQALIWIPDHDRALVGITALAERHDAEPRLIAAYQRLLDEASLPEHVVATALRLARLHRRRDELQPAERRYREVLDVAPHHVEALRSLCEIYQDQGRQHDYVEVFAELLEAEHDDLGDDEIIDRTLELARLLAERGNKRKEALDRLEHLARTYPAHRRVHEAFVEQLEALRHWQRAIDALKTASDAVGDPEFRRTNLARAAELYEHKLNLPDRAIGAWAELVEEHDDPEALDRLRVLYLDSGQFEPALPIIDRRIDLLDRDDTLAEDERRTLRASLLVAKARVLQEGFDDEEGAAKTLEELLEEDPDNDEVALGLSRLYRRVGRLDEGIELLRSRWKEMSAEPRERYVKMTSALADVLDRDGHDPKGSLEVIREALQTLGDDDTWLLRIQARLARTLHDSALLAEALSKLPDLDALLEAGDLFRSVLGESHKALRLYSRVLAEAKQDPDDPEHARRLAAALEGLVKLRLDSGDPQGAMAFMDEQLEEMRGPAIRAQLLTEMGRITYRTTGDIAAARRRFAAALKEDPEYARAKLGLGEVLVEAKAHEEAETLLEEALESLTLSADPADQVEALVLLARVLEDQGRSGEAYRRLTMAARHAPDNIGIRAAIVRNRAGAKRWRDVVTAADQVEQQLAGGFERTPPLVALVAEIMVMAARAELELRRPDKATERLRRSLEFEPENSEALEPLVGLCQERGALGEAAKYALALARNTEDTALRGRRYIDAGMLYHEAAAALADGADLQTPENEAELRKAAFESLRMGLELIESIKRPVIEFAQLDAVFRAAAQSDPQTALKALERLLSHRKLAPEHREGLLLEGIHIALHADDHETAQRHADALRREYPASPQGVLAKAEVLEAIGQADAIEDLVESYFEDLDHDVAGSGDVSTRVQLLLRLAEIQRSRPAKAIAALERAAQLDAGALDAERRRELAGLYAEADITDERARTNHAHLLELDPLHIDSLEALASHHASRGDLDRAYALYRVLALRAPDHPQARAFIDAHMVVEDGSGDLDLKTIARPAPPSAGIPEALLALWEGGAAVLGEYLPRVEVPQEARISPLGDDLLAGTWGEVLKRLGQSKVALADDRHLAVNERDVPDAARDAGYFQLHCQHPPVIVALEGARTTEDPARLRFALGRAVFFSRPEAVFAAGLRRIKLAQLLSATLQAFHPRHSRRKHHQKTEDFVARLSQELARKLPMRVSRQLTTLFKEQDSAPFDSRVWRAWVRQGGNRIGLVLGGDIEAALAVVLGEADDLQDAVATDDDLRDLVAFASSAAFVDARKRLGYHVAPRQADVAEG